MSIRKAYKDRIKYTAIVVGGAGMGALVYYFLANALLYFMVGWLFFIPMVGIIYMVQGFQEYRTISRNISLDEKYIEKLKPSLEKHQGNFSAAIRDIINQNTNTSSYENPVSLDNNIFKWILNETDGLLLPDNILNELIDPCLISSMEKLERFLNNKFRGLEWGINIVLKYDSNTSPSEVLIEIGGDSQKIRLVASMISQFLVKNSLNYIPLKIMSTINLDKYIKVELSRSNRTEAIDSLVTFFGSSDETNEIIKSKPAFWKAIFNTYISSNYNMVTVHRNYFEDLFTGKVPIGEITIENLARKPISEIPLEKMILLIKQVYESSRIVDRVDIYEENLIFFHSYRNKEAIEKLRKSLLMLLNASGHIYNAKSTANMIVLMHQEQETN